MANREQPKDQNARPIRRARIPADHDAVWEDGSGGEARPRTREDVRGTRRVSGGGSTPRGRPLPTSSRVTHGQAATGGLKITTPIRTPRKNARKRK